MGAGNSECVAWVRVGGIFKFFTCGGLFFFFVFKGVVGLVSYRFRVLIFVISFCCRCFKVIRDLLRIEEFEVIFCRRFSGYGVFGSFFKNY